MLDSKENKNKNKYNWSEKENEIELKEQLVALNRVSTSSNGNQRQYLLADEQQIKEDKELGIEVEEQMNKKIPINVQQQTPNKVDTLYILWAIMSSVFNAIGQLCRGTQSEAAQTSNFLCSATWIFVPSIYIIYRKIRTNQGKDDFSMPWNVKRHSISKGMTYQFQLKILVILFFGGAFEFVGNSFLNESFSYGQQANFNDGITSALLLSSAVIIIIVSFIFFKEKINALQGIGLTIILGGIVIIGVYKSENELEPIKITPNNLTLTWNKILCIIMALLAAALNSGEVIIVKAVSSFQMDGDLCGYFYSFFVGIQGILCLIAVALFGKETLMSFTLMDYGIMIFGGSMEAIGMVLQMIAVNRGIAGIAFGIANTCSIYVLIFSYFFRNQSITLAQVLGIIFTILGSMIIALEEQIYSIFRKKQNIAN